MSAQDILIEIDNVKEKLTSHEYKNLCDLLMRNHERTEHIDLSAIAKQDVKLVMILMTIVSAWYSLIAMIWGIIINEFSFPWWLGIITMFCVFSLAILANLQVVLRFDIKLLTEGHEGLF